MNDENQPKKHSRRTLLKQSALSTGLITVGLTGNAAACEEERGNYEEADPWITWLAGDEWVDSRCENGKNTGTKMDLGSAVCYWYSDPGPHPNDDYRHYFSNHSYGEHYDEDLDCNWEHSERMEFQIWSARAEQEGHTIGIYSGNDPIGVYPEMDNGQDSAFNDLVYTGMEILLDRVIPDPIMNAAQITNALVQEENSSSHPMWDARQRWDNYTNMSGCMAHWVHWMDAGDEDRAHTTTEDLFSSEFGVATVETEVQVNYPRYPDTKTETAKTEAISSPETVHSTSLGEKISVGDTVDFSNALKKGDTVSDTSVNGLKPDGQNMEAEIMSIKELGQEKRETEQIKVDEEEYKERHPKRYNENGAPEYLYRYPATATTTVITAKWL